MTADKEVKVEGKVKVEREVKIEREGKVEREVKVERKGKVERDVKVEGELSEGAPGGAQYHRLVVDLQSTPAALSRETDRVPRVQRHLANAPATTQS